MTLTQQLRQKLKSEAADRSTREMGRLLGVNHTTLWRFLSGETPNARLIDALYARYSERLGVVQ